jgi:hypothetical protein
MLHIFWECSQGVGFRPMRWFRGHGRLGGWVALVAIALQLVLSFGHVHHEAYAHASEIAALAADGSNNSQPSNPAAPSDHDYCSLCAVLSLLAGAQGAAAPALPVPTATAAIALIAKPETVHAAELRPAFRSRAPPLV